MELVSCQIGLQDIVSTKWKVHEQTMIKGTDKDFKRLNKSAIKERATTAHVKSTTS